ncbi:MAG: SpoIID/LytB domain-containing protein [Eubacteriales bacterium]|nr:SpoIID/LytB domain-containing protein [Eubacteriales bacterium]MDD4512929.1 SpoIID/LytB domain-containing protein [Eubacteriales bacterium]
MKKKIKTDVKRIVVGAIVILLCLALIGTSFVGMFASAEPIAAEKTQKLESQPIVRVLLSRLGITDRTDISFACTYSIGRENEPLAVLREGTEATFYIVGNDIYMEYGLLTMNLGAKVLLTRYAGDDEYAGINIDVGTAAYPGDLTMSAADGKLRLVLSIGLEEYTKGVVPYEMSESFPLEALKAQAIAVRTYAARKIDSSKDYDVVDTTNDQVFKGVDRAFSRCIQAVDETRGVVGWHNRKMAICYYSASNGGQTDLVSHRWSATEDFSYYQMNDDPYDLENPQSLVRLYRVAKRGAELKEEFSALLIENLSETAEKKGYDTAEGSLRIDEIKGVEVKTPMYADSPTKVMTEIAFTVAYSGKKPLAKATAAPDEEENMFSVTSAPSESPAPTLTPKPDAKASLTDFTAEEENAVITLKIFPLLESEMGLSLNQYDNEIITVTEQSGYYQIESRRYGHGLGMSQRGAEQMAQKYDMSYTQIIDFYYPKMELMRLTWESESREGEPPSLVTPGPKPTVTPRPTLMPMSFTDKDGLYIAEVDNIDEDSSLNLRAEPSQSAEIVRRLYKHQQLLVMEVCDDESWVKVKTDAAEGYVMLKFLTKVEAARE